MTKRIVVKVGTKVLTDSSGVLNEKSLANIAEQISKLKSSGHDVVLVSSGAMGAGKSLLKTNKPLKAIAEKQLFAAIGQAHLIHRYSVHFKRLNLYCAQILATKEDFRDKAHYTNMKTCFESLLHDKVIPIVNENDAISLNELIFTDNDELAGYVASMLNADILIILTSVNGLLDTAKSPTKTIATITPKTTEKYINYITNDKSEAGRGGMSTKFAVGKKLAKQGIEVIIANGYTENIIIDIITGKKIGTKFIAGKKIPNARRRLAHAENQVRGKVIVIKPGAVSAITDETKANSLLFVGIHALQGDFKKGDVIEILNSKDQVIGYGIAQYNSNEATKLIGQKNIKPLIHYDKMFIC